MKGVVLCLAADRLPLAGSTNTNDAPGHMTQDGRLI